MKQLYKEAKWYDTPGYSVRILLIMKDNLSKFAFEYRFYRQTKLRINRYN